MSQSIILDNWSLQNISELLTEGMSSDNASIIELNQEKDSHYYRDISSAIISIEALFDFITDVILRDQILVEEKFAYAWKQYDTPLIKILDEGVIRPYQFLIDPKKLIEPRIEFVERLCLTSTLKKDHDENTVQWNESESVKHKYLSQTLWGGAGMLARAFVYEQCYTPHPIRRRLFQKAGIALSDEDSVIRLNSVIREKRALISASQPGKDEFYSLSMDLPPLPIRVIQEANSVNDLITVALQLREDYQELRHWLRLYQQALTEGDYYNNIDKYQKILHSISLYIDSITGNKDSNSPTFTARIGVLKLAIKGNPINNLKNQFGVRAMV